MSTPDPVSSTGSTPPYIHSCRVDTGSGVYFLDITSGQAFDFSACGDSPEAAHLAGLSEPGGDLRCRVQTTDALIGVYSAGARADRAAAQDYCDSVGGDPP